MKAIDIGRQHVSTVNGATPVSEVVGQTLPYSIFLVGVAFFLSFAIGTGIGMLAAWRRGGAVDNVLVPTFMTLSAFPAFFTGLLALYFLGLKAGWFPIQHGSVMAQVFSFLYSITEPVLGPLRRAIPPMGGLDLSPLVLLIGIQVVQSLVLQCRVGL